MPFVMFCLVVFLQIIMYQAFPLQQECMGTAKIHLFQLAEFPSDSVLPEDLGPDILSPPSVPSRQIGLRDYPRDRINSEHPCQEIKARLENCGRKLGV